MSFIVNLKQLRKETSDVSMQQRPRLSEHTPTYNVTYGANT